MKLVALMEVATTVDALVPALATELALTAFEARQKLVSGLPCVLLMTGDSSRAASLCSNLRAQGHSAVVVDSSDVVPSSAMVPIRRFRFADDGLVLDEGAEGTVGTVVPAREMAALVRASHRREVETREETKEKKFRPGAALVTGGLILTKTVKREVVRTSEDREQVLYLFRRGGPPCLLSEGSAHYGGLGDLLRPTRIENFATTLRVLRERAATVPYDGRLLAVKRFPPPPNEASSTPGARRAFDPETGGVDLLAHLVAHLLATPVYRSG